MYVYLSVMVLCCIILYAMRNLRNKVTPLAIVFSIIWLMISLQDGWGGDHDAYELLFEQIQGLNFSQLLTDTTHGEIGYKLLMSIMPSAHMGLVVGMAIWCFSMAFFFYHFIPQRLWFFAILFIFFDRSILMGMVASYTRMSIACSFLIFAIYNVLRDKRLLAIVLIILGALFHKSVLFLLPLVFVGKKQNRLDMPVMIGIFAVITIMTMMFPSAWIGFVENIVMGVDTLGSYSEYFEEQQALSFKGIVLIILFYWIFLLSKKTKQGGIEAKEYLTMYYALIRIGFDLLPAFGLSTRFFYYIDVLFFAGMMCLMDRTSKQDIHRYAIAVTLLLIFWYDGFRLYANSSFYQEHWATYNFIF